LNSDGSLISTGLAFTLGDGNDLVCQLIEEMALPLIGREIEELMAEFGAVFKTIADHPRFRWLGPHKGMVHLALASITNACFDLWAKSRGVPLWRLLLDLSPEQVVDLLDLSYLEDVLLREEAIEMLTECQPGRARREVILETGYPGYDTSIGWFDYADDVVLTNVRKAVDAGFSAMKLKVGSPDTVRDVRRAYLVREAAGEDAKVMLDANQSWSLPKAIKVCMALADMRPYWIEEPTHPDDVLAHRTLARAIAPMKIALGEHVSHRVLFTSC
jgi:L-fuconate dehydratase